jgi:endogenous inhibitor of DNA gyrase (YacG/DUF329 family)
MSSRKNKMGFCPICKKKVEKVPNQYFPFCSERCKLVDLGAWLGGQYKIPNKPGLDFGELEDS